MDSSSNDKTHTNDTITIYSRNNKYQTTVGKKKRKKGATI